MTSLGELHKRLLRNRWCLFDDAIREVTIRWWRWAVRQPAYRWKIK